MDPYNREGVLVSLSWTMYSTMESEGSCPNCSTDMRNMLLVNVFTYMHIRVETTSIPQCAGFSGQYT